MENNIIITPELVNELEYFFDPEMVLADLQNNTKKTLDLEDESLVKKSTDEIFDMAYNFVSGKNGHKRDIRKAMFYYAIAAVKGNVAAIGNMGINYYTSSFYDYAFLFTSIAAVKGDKWSNSTLADCYRYGKGTKRNNEKVIPLYSNSANAGNTYAMFALGQCFENGDCVKCDLTKAIQYYQQAAKSGHKGATDALSRLKVPVQAASKNTEFNKTVTPKPITISVNPISQALRQLLDDRSMSSYDMDRIMHLDREINSATNKFNFPWNEIYNPNEQYSISNALMRLVDKRYIRDSNRVRNLVLSLRNKGL